MKHSGRVSRPAFSQRASVDDVAKRKHWLFRVKTARGGARDEEAPLTALDSGKRSGVGLDVY